MDGDTPAAAAGDEARAVSAAVRAARAGNTEAYGEVVKRFQGRVFALALILTRQPAAAEEVAQDAFVRAFKNLQKYDEARPFYPWLATIAVRLAQNWLHQQAVSLSRKGPAAPSAEEGRTTSDPLDALIADERSRKLWQLVAALPPGERAAVLLHYRHDMSIAEVARALGVTSGTVKTHLFRARQRLRQDEGWATSISRDSR